MDGGGSDATVDFDTDDEYRSAPPTLSVRDDGPGLRCYDADEAIVPTTAHAGGVPVGETVLLTRLFRQTLRQKPPFQGTLETKCVP